MYIFWHFSSERKQRARIIGDERWNKSESQTLNGTLRFSPHLCYIQASHDEYVDPFARDEIEGTFFSSRLAQHTKQNYSIKITILCVPKKQLLGDLNGG